MIPISYSHDWSVHYPYGSQAPRLIRLLVLALILLALPGQVALAAEVFTLPDRSQSASIPIAAGKSLILASPVPVTRVSVAQPEIADFVLLSPRQIYVTGKEPGNTNLTLWSGGNEVRGVYDLEVSPDVAQLKKTIHDVMPDEPGLEVHATPASVTLSGTVKDSANVTKAVSLASAFSPGKVVNLIQVGGVHQVMLEVRVAEMNKSVMDRLGFNFNYFFNGKDFFYSFLNNLTTLDDQGRLLLSDQVNAAFRFTNGKATWSGFIDALKENGLIKILAEPTLICLSGQTASFLAGGEIPIPVPQGLGTVAIEYKEFGVRLKFTPTVLSGNKISLQVHPEVSELDYTNAININGFLIPAITARRASTMIELAEGQSFAIAGLMRNHTRENTARFPFIGDLPVLGNLFRSDSYQKNETELVIIATPRLAKPQDQASVKLPTSVYRDPTDLEFFLNLPRSFPREEAASPSPAYGLRRESLDGEFGNILPGRYGKEQAGTRAEAL